jgi:hypothetical protein
MNMSIDVMGASPPLREWFEVSMGTGGLRPPYVNGLKLAWVQGGFAPLREWFEVSMGT